MSTTIAAIATPQAPGGIGIIRISGRDALPVAARVFRAAGSSDLTESPGYRAYFGAVYSDNEKIDEAICLVFRAPKSYTGEDVAELHCHGGLFLTQQTLRAVLAAGAVPAEPGEFTKRAFLNGKRDLAAAESVMALIGAAGQQAAAAALQTLDGTLSKEIRACADRILSVTAALAAWVDYPDEDLPQTDTASILSVFRDVRASLQALLRRYDCGKVLTAGVDTAIVGRPNVGKSTLMNLLSGFDRSIVTAVAGTTRDVVEETVRLGDLLLRVADTAGIRDTADAIEHLGVDRARRRLAGASLALAVFDGSAPLTADDRAVIAACAEKPAVAVLNKADLPPAADCAELEAAFDRVVTLSAATGEGLETLEQAIADLLGADAFDPSAACLVNERQRQCCARAADHLSEAISALERGVTLDAVTVCADCAVDALLELTGERATSATVDAVFRNFCVGK
ncbi:MAG: tRNA uridine-5-carboxymethylaminomethyl(34) synthesis GTPase MnmE [Clostridia bacterium]|nr:tRNA uridine-5-carboxymethylaminomethyl(34) synthesis GTPase MnmE [Clostridia bacterium]